MTKLVVGRVSERIRLTIKFTNFALTSLQNSAVWSPATDIALFPCKKAKNLASQNMDRNMAKIKGNEMIV